MWPSEENDDFYELCEKIKSKYSLEKLGTIKKEEPIELGNIKIDKELLEKVIHNAHNRGYEDLERRLVLLRNL